MSLYLQFNTLFEFLRSKINYKIFFKKSSKSRELDGLELKLNLNYFELQFSSFVVCVRVNNLATQSKVSCNFAKSQVLSKYLK